MDNANKNKEINLSIVKAEVKLRGEIHRNYRNIPSYGILV